MLSSTFTRFLQNNNIQQEFKNELENIGDDTLEEIVISVDEGEENCRYILEDGNYLQYNLAYTGINWVTMDTKWKTWCSKERRKVNNEKIQSKN